MDEGTSMTAHHGKSFECVLRAVLRRGAGRYGGIAKHGMLDLASYMQECFQMDISVVTIHISKSGRDTLRVWWSSSSWPSSM